MRFASSTAIVAIAAAALLPACFEDEVDLGTVEAYGAATPDHELQGRTFLGAIEDLPRTNGTFFAVPTTSTTGQLVYAGRGKLASSGTTVVGLAFKDALGREIAITSELPADPGAKLPQRYGLWYVDAGDPAHPTGFDPCAGEMAIPLSGTYTVTHQHVPTEGWMTWSCETGVTYKCNRWGFPEPGDSADDHWDLNQACLYEANADYCYNGKTNTRDGTAISMWDDAGVFLPIPRTELEFQPWILKSWPPPLFVLGSPGQYFLEGFWPAEGGVRCLSKRRWASLPLDPCAGSVPDPRVPFSGGRYCEDLVAEGTPPVDGDILLVNSSLFNDAAYEIWRTATGDLLGTVRGFYDRVGVSKAPFTGMTHVGQGGQTGVMLRALTEDLVELYDSGQLTMVNLYCIGMSQRCVVTTPALQPLSHKHDYGPEGYVFTTERPHTIALTTYYKAATGDYVTSTVPPTASGYTPGDIVGYILPNAE